MSERTEEFPLFTPEFLSGTARSSKDCLRKDLREQLESLPRYVRKNVVKKKNAGCTVLALASVAGNADLVEYLIQECDANIEQRSTKPLGPSYVKYSYTPLCLACLAQNFEVVDRLVQLGANIDALADCGSTPVMIACSVQSDTIVRYLVEKGADVRKNNFSGDSCLIAWITAVLNDWYYFGDQDLKMIQLLIDHGADPFAKTRNGYDALQFVCLRRCRKIANYLMTVIDYSPESKAEANELLGAMLFCDSRSELSLTVSLWYQAHLIRQNRGNYIQKRAQILPHPIYGNIHEFTSNAELDTIANDVEAVRIQTLLILERILGIDDEKTLEIMDLFAEHYRSRNKQKSLDLWLLALHRLIKKHTILYGRTVDIARKILSLILNLLNTRAAILPRFEDVCCVFQLLTANVIEAHRLLSKSLVHYEQQILFDHMVNFLPYLLYALLPLANSEQKRALVTRSVEKLVLYDIRIVTGETLLHLALKQSEAIDSDFWLTGSDSEQIFRNLDAVKLLVECGAHLDLPDSNNVRPSDILAKHPQNNIRLVDYTTLKCSAANVIVECGILYDSLPKRLKNFVRAHEQHRDFM